MEIFFTVFLSLLSLLTPQKIEKLPTSIILGGDVMLGRTVMSTSFTNQDYTYPFAKISGIIKPAGIAFVNLENPITTGCKEDLTRTSMVFCARPEMLEGLIASGINIVNLANNHTTNYGKAGFEETKEHLSRKNILYAGDNNLVIKSVGNTSFGFLGFDKSQQTNPMLTNEEKNLILESDQKVDVLIASIHWGVEYQDKALPGVVRLAHELVDLGVDVVHGHHPHWVQNIEYYKNVPIYYSLGNLVFDQMWSERTREGLLVKLTFKDDKIIKEELIKTYMEVWAQPQAINIPSPKL